MPEGPAGAPRLTNIGPLSRSTAEEIREEWSDCPREGKEAEICTNIKKVAIAILEGQGIFAKCSTVEEINGGNCGNVAFTVNGKVDGVTVMMVGDGDHFWIEFDGRHYDAEVPTGVDDPLVLPFFQRTPHDVLIRHSRMEAERLGQELPETIEEAIKSVEDTE